LTCFRPFDFGRFLVPAGFKTGFFTYWYVVFSDFRGLLIMTQTAKLISPRRGRHTAYHYQYILDVGLTDRKGAEKMLGKSVEWKTPGKKVKAIKGKITRVHGGKGKVVAQFEKGLPGQSMGTAVAVA